MSASVASAAAVRLPALPPAAPPDAPRRGRPRLLVARRGAGGLEHRVLADLPGLLAAGDVLVVNTSKVIPAALPAVRDDGSELRVHLSTRLPGGWWLVELRRPDGAGSLPLRDGRAGEQLALPAGGTLRLLAAHAGGPKAHADGSADVVGARLWLTSLRHPGGLHAYLDAHGGPVRYSLAGKAAGWPLESAQTVFATTPGSAEPASAALGFTGELVARLVAAGIELAPLLLHCGVSSQEGGEPPYPEWYEVPATTARRVNRARTDGGRVVAVGTTVTRALETVADERGSVHPGRGWTEHVVSPASGLRAVQALLTGWHDPEGSHLALVEAVAGAELTRRSYLEAAATGYRGHEFGDLHLILP